MCVWCQLVYLFIPAQGELVTGCELLVPPLGLHRSMCERVMKWQQAPRDATPRKRQWFYVLMRVGGCAGANKLLCVRPIQSWHPWHQPLVALFKNDVYVALMTRSNCKSMRLCVRIINNIRYMMMMMMMMNMMKPTIAQIEKWGERRRRLSSNNKNKNNSRHHRSTMTARMRSIPHQVRFFFLDLRSFCHWAHTRRLERDRLFFLFSFPYSLFCLFLLLLSSLFPIKSSLSPALTLLPPPPFQN